MSGPMVRVFSVFSSLLSLKQATGFYCQFDPAAVKLKLDIFVKKFHGAFALYSNKFMKYRTEYIRGF